jgi:hypothetical protein
LARLFHPVGCIAVLLLLQIGCGGGGADNLPATVDASGVVLLDGQPVHGASVVFVPVSGNYSAFASTDSSGRFELKSFEAKEGAVPGSYQVQVTKTIEVKETPNVEGPDAAHAQATKGAVSWENALPSKYADPVNSGIKVDIPDTGRSDIKIELVSANPA